ncbi:MAG: ACP S-malonyltransferase [Steroidobacteraceae bacterium]
MKIAMVFPGQGSQTVGMLGGLANEFSIIQSTFSEASAALGFDLWQLVQSGPDSALNLTENTQPALLAASIALYRVWRECGGREPDVVTGHSLGEFAALVCAEALAFPDAIRLVRFRGQAMQAAVPAGEGAMAALLGLEDDEVKRACASAQQGQIVEAVNFNAPGQVVIAGHAAAVDRAIEGARALGAKRAVKLPVSAPFHSSLMQQAARQFSQRLDGVAISPPRYTFVSAADTEIHAQPEDVRQALAAQLAAPVQWTKTVAALLAMGVTHAVEMGPGKVLTTLNRRIGRDAALVCMATDDAAGIRAAITQLNGAQA